MITVICIAAGLLMLIPIIGGLIWQSRNQGRCPLCGVNGLRPAVKSSPQHILENMDPPAKGSEPYFHCPACRRVFGGYDNGWPFPISKEEAQTIIRF